MKRGQFERLLDDALFAVALSAGILYVRRRTRRAMRNVGRGAALLVGAAVATAALAAVGAAVARQRRRS